MVEVKWGNPEKDIVIWTFTPPWTFDEFHIAQKQADIMTDSVNRYVDSIFLTTQYQKIPKNGVTHLRKIVATSHIHQRFTIVVGADIFTTILVNDIAELVPGFKDYLFFARTQSEALSILDNLRLHWQG